MITLSVMNSASRSGCVRKVIHAPSLRLYCIKQIPISTRGERQNLLEWLGKWQSIQARYDELVNVCATFWNTPEGCVSVVMEHNRGDSLQQLIDSVGAIPEAILAPVFQRLVGILGVIHLKIGPHSGITASQILFDGEQNVRISLGLALRTQRSGATTTANVYELGLTLLVALFGGSD